MSSIHLSHVAYQPHAVITHELMLGSSLLLRLPEFVRSADGADMAHPGRVTWETLEPDFHLRFQWDESTAVKRRWGADFSGEVRAGDDAVAFEVTMQNVGDAPHGHGLYLFCLAAGGNPAFQDYEGQRTFVRLAHRWTSVHDLVAGRFEEHRICGFGREDSGIACNMMAKTSRDGRWALAIALDQPGRVSSNHQIWPSCIHANPIWPRLAPGESATARGRVYLMRGGLDQVYQRYLHDFERQPAAGECRQ